MHAIPERDAPLILFADDERISRLLLRRLLGRAGYEFIEAENGAECLDAYQAHAPDMVLLDAMMPVMDGFTCCRQLRQLPKGDRIPILTITGLDDKESVDEAFAAGATDYITKPIHPPVLERRLRRLLEASQAEAALRESEAKYRSVVNSLKEAIFQADRDGKFTFLNPAWTQITGFSVEESLGRSLLEFMHPDERNNYRDRWENLARGALPESRDFLRYAAKNGRCGWVEIYASEITSEDASASPISGTIEDITERKRRESQRQVEHAVTKVLAVADTPEVAIPQLLHAIGEGLGWEVGEFWSLEAKGEHLQRSANWQLPHLTIARPANFSLGSGFPSTIWQQRSPSWSSSLSSELQTAFGFPILSGEEILGVMTFFSRQLQPSDRNELELVVTLGGQIGQFLKRKQAESALHRQNQILQQELKQAAAYVRSLLPKPEEAIVLPDASSESGNECPVEANITVEQCFIPSLQLGGDAFDYFWLDEEFWVVYLLDVAGHGVRSALLSVSVLNLLRSRSLHDTDLRDPAAVLTELNRAFQMSDSGDDYFTIWYGVYNRRERSLCYSCAGHPPALLFSEQGNLTSFATSGLPIGILPDAVYEGETHAIAPGSILYLFSDGVYEIRQPDGDIWGLDAWVQLLGEQIVGGDRALAPLLERIGCISGDLDALNDDFSLLQVLFQ